MPRKTLTPDQHLRRDRPGQLPRPNTFRAAVLELLPTDHFVGMDNLFQTVAERHPSYEYDALQKALWSLAKRNLIEREMVRGRRVEMQQRRLIIE
jgi:hypothetical protein